MFYLPFFCIRSIIWKSTLCHLSWNPYYPSCMSLFRSWNQCWNHSYRTCYSHHSLFPCWRAEGHVWSIGSFTRLTTTYMPFIGSQQPREDLQTAMYSNLDLDTKIEEEESPEDVEIDEEKVPLNEDA